MREVTITVLVSDENFNLLRDAADRLCEEGRPTTVEHLLAEGVDIDKAVDAAMDM